MSPARQLRASIYLRVSDPSKQTVANQREECLALAAGRKYEVVEVYEEGASAAAVRPVFERMKLDARRHRFDVLIIWAVDRFGRSFVSNVLDVADFDRLGVLVVSVKDGWLDTTSGLVRNVLVGVFSAMAEHERERHRERVLAGMRRARAEGKHLGRPRLADGTRPQDRRKARRLALARAAVQAGSSARSAAIQHKVALSTLRGYLAREEA